MSTVFVDTIKNQTGTTSLAANKLPDMLSGSSKAWCCWNGTGTAAIRDSHNVSSLTDNGSGDFSQNFTNNYGSANYVISGCMGWNSAISNYVYNLQPSQDSGITSSSARVYCMNSGVSSGTAYSAKGDYYYSAFHSHGDLA